MLCVFLGVGGKLYDRKFLRPSVSSWSVIAGEPSGWSESWIKCPSICCMNGRFFSGLSWLNMPVCIYKRGVRPAVFGEAIGALVAAVTVETWGLGLLAKGFPSKCHMCYYALLRSISLILVIGIRSLIFKGRLRGVLMQTGCPLDDGEEGASHVGIMMVL